MDSKNCIETFNATVRKMFDLFRDLPKKIGTAVAVSEVRTKMLQTMSIQPDYAIVVLGPYIWNRRGEIKESKTKWFLDHDYTQVLLQLSAAHKFNFEDACKAVKSMKTAFSSAESAKQAEIVSTLQSLLNTYAVYVLKCKEAK